MSEPLLCVGGSRHGQMANDVGMWLRVPVNEDFTTSIFEPPRIKHGPGYRRLPRIRQLKLQVEEYVQRHLIVSGQLVKFYVMAEYPEGRALIKAYLDAASPAARA